MGKRGEVKKKTPCRRISEKPTSMFLSRPREILFLSLSRIDLPPSPSSSSTASVLPFCTASRPCACSSTSCSRHCMARTAVAGSRKNEFLYLNMEYHLGIYQKCFNAIPWITQRRDEVEVVVAEIAQPIGILLEDVSLSSSVGWLH